MAQTMDNLDINLNVNVTGLPEIQVVQRQMRNLDRQISSSTGSVRAATQAYSRNGTQLRRWAKGALQQAGYQVGDFAVQVANGTNGIQAFGQQGSQLLGIFGPIGAVLGAAVAIFSAVAVAASKAGGEVQNVSSVLGVLRDPIMGVVDGLKSFGRIFDGFGKTVLQNVDTVIIFAGILAGVYLKSVLFGAQATSVMSRALEVMRYQKALAASQGKMLSASMAIYSSATMYATVVTRALGAALKRLFPIAVMMAAAKLVEMFIQLMRGAGGFINALKLLGMVVAETVQRMIMKFDLGYSKLSLGAQNFKLTFISGLRSIAEFFDNFVEGLATRWNASFGKFEPLRIDIGEGMSGVLEDMETSTQQTINRLNGHIQSIDEALAQPNQSVQDLIEAFQNGEITASIFGDAIEEVMTGTGGAGDAIDEVANRVKSLEQSISGSMENAFMSIVDGTKSAKDAFKDMAKSIIAELYRVLVVQQIVGAAMSALGFGGGKATQAISEALPKRAQGGAVSANRPYIVGERGPEMLVPSTSGRVIPNNQLGGGSSGQPVVINYNFQGGVTEADLGRALPLLVERTKREVVEAVQRGGSVARVFR